MSLFEHVKEFPPDPIFGLTKQFKDSTHPQKVDLSVGIYRNEDLKAEIPPSVKQAERDYTEQEENKVYLPIAGNMEFTECVRKLVLGDAIPKENVFVTQTPGGTCALRMGGEFLHREGIPRIAAPSPTWANHKSIFTASHLEFEKYTYYNIAEHRINFEEMIENLKQIPEGTILLMHASSHNPTGCDPTPEQWKLLSDLCHEKKFIPFFDCAYQGLGNGFEEDVASIRLFVQNGHELIVSYSCSKNFGLYGERTGALLFIGKDSGSIEKVASSVKNLIRSNYSNPPRHGAGIVATILSDEKRKAQWEGEVANMRNRVKEMREIFSDRLTRGTGNDYSYLRGCSGMFCYTGLEASQVEVLKSKYGIFMPESGRVNVTGLSHSNLDYVVDSITDVLKSV